MSEHTPGTWRAVCSEDGVWWRVVTDFDGSWDADLARIEPGGLPGEAEANARLMAGSQGLCEAANTFLAALGFWQGELDPDHWATREAFALADALAKAEGREP